MSHKLGLSGSTILSNPAQFQELFLDELDHIEIGEFPNEAAFQQFLNLVMEENKTFGIHSPLQRGESKYDLIEHVQMKPENAWGQFETEIERVSSLGAEYILVHFPYFKQERNRDVHDEIERGLEKLSKLQNTYKLPIVCEPKLGQNRNPCNIHYLDTFPLERWEQYELTLCMDVGDYLLGDADHIEEHIDKWLDHIKVVHLHNVSFENDKYIWSPVHPDQEHNSNFHTLKPLIQKLAKGKEKRFLFEHTPHHIPSHDYVLDGIDWVRSLIRS